MAKQLLNLLLPDSAYQVMPGVGPVIWYHGRTLDLRQVTKEQAEALAQDADARYVRKKPRGERTAPPAPVPERKARRRGSPPDA